MASNVDRSDANDSTAGARTPTTGVSWTTPGDPTRGDRGAGIMWSGIAVVVLMALLLVVAVQNTQDVDFRFLWFDTSIPLILILAITFGIALVATETVGFVWRHRRRKARRERDELERLRTGAR